MIIYFQLFEAKTQTSFLSGGYWLVNNQKCQIWMIVDDPSKPEVAVTFLSDNLCISIFHQVGYLKLAIQGAKYNLFYQLINMERPKTSYQKTSFESYKISVNSVSNGFSLFKPYSAAFRRDYQAVCPNTICLNQMEPNSSTKAAKRVVQEQNQPSQPNYEIQHLFEVTPDFKIYPSIEFQKLFLSQSIVDNSFSNQKQPVVKKVDHFERRSKSEQNVSVKRQLQNYLDQVFQKTPKITSEHFYLKAEAFINKKGPAQKKLLQFTKGQIYQFHVKLILKYQESSIRVRQPLKQPVPKHISETFYEMYSEPESAQMEPIPAQNTKLKNSRPQKPFKQVQYRQRLHVLKQPPSFEFDLVKQRQKPQASEKEPNTPRKDQVSLQKSNVKMNEQPALQNNLVPDIKLNEPNTIDSVKVEQQPLYLTASRPQKSQVGGFYRHNYYKKKPKPAQIIVIQD